MREYYFKPKAEDNLVNLDATEDDVRMIVDIVKMLASGEKKGDPLMIQQLEGLLNPGQKLYQYPVGRYKLNYSLTEKELLVESINL